MSPKMSYDEIINGNLELHRKEAAFYDLIHYEIWNHAEQKRLWKTLEFATSQIRSNSFSALDFGAGTGNITEKLLALGFHVTAVDLSPEMLFVLRIKNKLALNSGKLKIRVLNIDKTILLDKYDLITSFAVLHHLPDYLGTLRKLLRLVKPGGVCFIDHEHTKKEYAGSNHGFMRRIFDFIYYLVNSNFLLKLYYAGVNLPKLDYSKSDIHNDELDYSAIQQLLRKEGFEILSFMPYYTDFTPFETPLNLLQRMIIKANCVLIIARKNVK